MAKPPGTESIACGCGGEACATAAPVAGAPSRWRGRAPVLITAASGLALATAFALHAALAGWRPAFGAETGPMPPAVTALYLLAVLAGFWLVAPRAWRSLVRLRPDMNLLMTLAVLGALLLGDHFEAATVSFLFAFSLLLESWSVGRARRAIAKLLALAPERARVLREGQIESLVPVEFVAVGARLRVLAGERIPLDGVLRAGQGTVDQSPITGESLPVAKLPGDAVFAGCVNGEGLLEIEVSHTARESLLARILREVEGARARRAQAERWVDRFARVYTPAMLALAALLALLPPLVAGGDWARWLYQALVLLVIACPCALVISTPVSIVAGLARAAREGVLIKGGAYLELPARLAAIAFDKTGTLSRGRLSLARVLPAADLAEDELLALAAGLEARSGHPLAAAVGEAASARGLTVRAAEALATLPGRGLEGRVAGRTYWLGSPAWMAELGRPLGALAAEGTALERSGHSLLVLADEERVLGLLAARDALRPEAPAALAALARLGLARQEVLSGDSEAAAQALAPAFSAAGAAPTIRAGLLPAEKAAAVRALRAAGPVAMVGDGINDAPALAEADLGIAMGAIGTDAAIETADIALMTDHLDRLPWLVAHSRRVLGVIRQNVALALGLKLLFLGLALAGQATLWMAIVADMGASLLVIGNGLRLLGAPGAARYSAKQARPA
ncbi:heavy metal translocating P-type ATPase [bacterium]|nr:heavy metal translocating P-type ATPase [bacterium]